MKLRFDLISLFFLVAGCAFGLGAYNATKESQLPPIPKYTEGMYFEHLPLELDEDGFSDIYEIVAVKLHGEPGNWYYDYSIEQAHGLWMTSGNGHVPQSAIDAHNTENQDFLRKRYKEYYDFCNKKHDEDEKRKQKEQILRKTHEKPKQDDNVATRSLRKRNSEVPTPHHS